MVKWEENFYVRKFKVFEFLELFRHPIPLRRVFFLLTLLF